MACPVIRGGSRVPVSEATNQGRDGAPGESEAGNADRGSNAETGQQVLRAVGVDAYLGELSMRARPAASSGSAAWR
jgi:hypothetical protein